MSSLRNKIESAFKAHLDTTGTGATQYTGIGYEDKVDPCVICQVASMTENPLHSGNFDIEVRITVKAGAGSSSAFDAVCDAVTNALWTDELETDLMAAQSGMTVFGASGAPRIEYSTDGGMWVGELSINIHACNTDFS